MTGGGVIGAKTTVDCPLAKPASGSCTTRLDFVRPLDDVTFPHP